MKKILITGGAGFIGANLIAFLNDVGGYEITVLDDESLGKREDIDTPIHKFVHADISDADAFEEAGTEFDYVVHLAGSTRVVESVEDPIPVFQSNVVGTFNLLMYCRKYNIKNVIMASTGGAIVGDTEEIIHEELMPKPMAPYGASKLACEGFGHAFSSAYGMHITSARFSNVYGPRSIHKGSVVAHFYKQIIANKTLTVYGDGGQLRDYIFIEDLIKGIYKIFDYPAAGVFQLSTGKPTTINELIEAIKETVDEKYSIDVEYKPARVGEVYKTLFSTEKAAKELDFKATTELPEGLKKTWKWFLDNGYVE